MDKREEMKNIVERKLSIPYGKVHYYPKVSDKVKVKVTKHFDTNMNINSIVAFYDSTLMGSCKTGMVFMLSGAYYLSIFEKPFYFNYKDITDMIISPDKKGSYSSTNAHIDIKFTNDKSLSIGGGDFHKDNLKSLLQELKEQFLKWDDVVCIKPSGEVGKIHLTEDQKVKCNGIIHTAAVAAGGVGTGLAQIPLADNAIITPIQVTMITSLGAVFGIRVTEGVAKGIIGGAAASIIGRGAVQILLGWIPGVGNVINTATAAGITEAIGWMAVAHFFDLQQQDKAKYKVDGMKEGYNAASEEYEGKLRKQAEEFLKQETNYKKQINKYEPLLTEYEKYIQELEKKLDKTEEELRRLESMKTQYEALRNLKKCS